MLGADARRSSAAAASPTSRRPNVLTLAPEGEERSGNPWHIKRVPRRGVPRAVRAPLRLASSCSGCSTRASCAPTRSRSSAWAGTRSTPRCGSRSRSTTASRPRSRCATSRCASARPRPRAGLPRGAAAVSGRLSIVLHTHMPYVEGFGTWPFGEEWLWEAMATSYLPLLDVLDAHPGRVTLSLTPVLCDQLEAGGRRSSASSPSCARSGPRRTGATSRRPRTRAGARARALGGAVRARRPSASRRAAATSSARSRPHVSWTSSATHAVLPLLATDAGVRLQLGAGIASHRERFGALGRRLLAAGVRARAVARPAARGGRRARRLRRPHRRARLGSPAQLQPLRSAAGPLLVPIDRALMDLVWHDSGYPSHGAYRDTRTTPSTATRRGRSTARPTTRRAAPSRSARTRATSPRRRRGGWRAAGSRSARSTPSCSGTSGTRGSTGWRRRSRRASGGRRAGAARRRAGRRRRRAGPAPSCPPRAGASRATSRPGARPPAARARVARSARGAARARRRRPSGAARAARAAGAAGLRLGVRRHARDRRRLPARARRRPPPPRSSAALAEPAGSLRSCATLRHLLDLSNLRLQG